MTHPVVWFEVTGKDGDGLRSFCGGRAVLPPTTIPGGTTISPFADPEGNVVGLSRTDS